MVFLVGCQSSTASPPAVDTVGIPDAQPADGPAIDLVDDAPASDTLAGPPYPVLLCHGFFGFDNIGPINYFHGVVDALTAAGRDVHVTTVNPFQTSELRGAQLIAQVEQVIAKTGKAKVNLVAHSQGGLDARFVAHRIPERVSAVLTISAPHHGLHLADVFAGSMPGLDAALTRALLRMVSRPVYGDIAEDADMKAVLDALTTYSVSNFNAEHPDQPGVAYYSLSGISNLKDIDHPDCKSADAPPFIRRWAAKRDPLDPLMVAVAQVVGGSLINPAANDGMVRVSRCKWGTWLGCVPADHFDQVGQILGDDPGLGNPFDHLEFYRGIVDFLVSRGH